MEASLLASIGELQFGELFWPVGAIFFLVSFFRLTIIHHYTATLSLDGLQIDFLCCQFRSPTAIVFVALLVLISALPVQELFDQKLKSIVVQILKVCEHTKLKATSSLVCIKWRSSFVWRLSVFTFGLFRWRKTLGRKTSRQRFLIIVSIRNKGRVNCVLSEFAMAVQSTNEPVGCYEFARGPWCTNSGGFFIRTQVVLMALHVPSNNKHSRIRHSSRPWMMSKHFVFLMIH